MRNLSRVQWEDVGGLAQQVAAPLPAPRSGSDVT